MTPRRWATGVGAGLWLAVIALGPVVPATAGQRTAQLSIAIDNGRESAAVGDTPDYTITVTNTGANQVTGLVVTQSLPTGLAFGSADGGGIATADAVTWTTDLAAGQVGTFATSMTVTPTGDAVLRLASIACAAESPSGPPVVCAADSDLLPAGATAAAGPRTEPDATRATDPVGGRIWLISGLIGTALIAGTLAVVLIGRRRQRVRVDPTVADVVGDRAATGNRR